MARLKFRRVLAIALAWVIATALPAAADTELQAEGTVHGGFYSSEWDATTDINNMTAWAGRKVTFAGTFHGVYESDPNHLCEGSPCWFGNTDWVLEHAWDAKATPVANLTIPASAAAIAGGSYDAAILAWVQKVKAWLNRTDGPQRTLFIAPLQEQNGHWVPYGCDPANFRLAYARIRNIAINAGLNETRVRWVWAPNGATSTLTASHSLNTTGKSCKGTTLEDYYPGPDIVDVIGYSAYRGGEESVYWVTASVADDLREFAPDKPYVVLQTGAAVSPTRDQWIRDLFTWAHNDPNVMGIVWFNFSDGTYDWRVWNSSNQTGIAPGWRDALKSSSTSYQWPLTSWFQPGALTVAVPPGPCPNGEVCDTVMFVDAGGRWSRYSIVEAGAAVNSFYYGQPGDYPVSGDWDCNGTTTPGLYRQSDGFVYLRNTNTQGVANITYFFGVAGDIPIAGDFNGDGCDTLGIYRPSEGRVYISNTLGTNGGFFVADYSYYFGLPGDKPFVGDFNGDGTDTIGLHRQTTGFVYFRNTHSSGVADSSFFYGIPGDRILAADWDGDGDDTVAVYRPSTRRFYINLANTQTPANYTMFVGTFTSVVAG